MRVLFDENMPHPLRRHFTGFIVRTVQEMGWAGVKNGNLLTLAEGQNFDVLLTFDRNLEHQQNMARRTIAIVIVAALDKRIPALLSMMPDILATVSAAQPGNIYQVEKPDTTVSASQP